MVTSWVTTGFVAYQNNHMPNTDDPLALFDKIYDKPWTRLGPYLVGMSVGWFLFKTNCKIRMSKVSLHRHRLFHFDLFYASSSPLFCSSPCSSVGSPPPSVCSGWSTASTKSSWAPLTVLPTAHWAIRYGQWVWHGLWSPAHAAMVAMSTNFYRHHAYIHSHVSRIVPIWSIPSLFAYWHWIQMHHCIWEPTQWYAYGTLILSETTF